MKARESTFVRNLPNVLTTLRLVAVPLLIVLMVQAEGPSLAAGIVFLVASFTDLLDGWLARHFRVMSQYGKVVDPLADRLLVNSAVLLLCYYDSRWFGDGTGRLLGPEFLVVIVRDLLATYGWTRVRGQTMIDVTRLGKWSMASMMAGLTWLLLLPDATWPLWPFELGLALSVIVLAQYVHRYRWALTRHPRDDAANETSANPEPVVEMPSDPRVD